MNKSSRKDLTTPTASPVPTPTNTGTSSATDTTPFIQKNYSDQLISNDCNYNFFDIKFF